VHYLWDGFLKMKDLGEHAIAVHNSTEEESKLFRKAGEEKKSRKRFRGPYRKACAA